MSGNNEMKKRCPYCGETIKAQAKKCIHCEEWLECPQSQGIDHGQSGHAGNAMTDEQNAALSELPECEQGERISGTKTHKSGIRRIVFQLALLAIYLLAVATVPSEERVRREFEDYLVNETEKVVARQGKREGVFVAGVAMLSNSLGITRALLLNELSKTISIRITRGPFRTCRLIYAVERSTGKEELVGIALFGETVPFFDNKDLEEWWTE